MYTTHTHARTHARTHAHTHAHTHTHTHTHTLYIAQEFKVDIAFWGHHHTYQRTCPVYKSVCTDDGLIHVIIGMAGRELLPDFE